MLSNATRNLSLFNYLFAMSNEIFLPLLLFYLFLSFSFICLESELCMLTTFDVIYIIVHANEYRVEYFRMLPIIDHWKKNEQDQGRPYKSQYVVQTQRELIQGSRIVFVGNRK